MEVRTPFCYDDWTETKMWTERAEDVIRSG